MLCDIGCSRLLLSCSLFLLLYINILIFLMCFYHLLFFIPFLLGSAVEQKDNVANICNRNLNTEKRDQKTGE